MQRDLSRQVTMNGLLHMVLGSKCLLQFLAILKEIPGIGHCIDNTSYMFALNFFFFF